MLTVRDSAVIGVGTQAALFTVLGLSVGLTGAGWVVGLACGIVLDTMVARSLTRRGSHGLGPADLVTLTRGTLACGVAALTADSFLHAPVVTALVALSVPALLLDAVDGWVARRTQTASVFGARFDGEVDAFLMLVLSVYLARSIGAWVLTIGAARYAFAVAGWALPWLRQRLPFRYWRKVVTATASTALTIATADVAPPWLMVLALAGALGLVAESFGRDVWWLWRHRFAEAAQPAEGPRALRAGFTSGLALLLVWLALVAPTQPDRLGPGAFLRIPLEGLLVAGLLLVLPSRLGRTLATSAGVLLGSMTVLRILDLAFFETLGRPFNPVTDRGHLVSAIALIRDSANAVVATAVAAAATALAAGVLVCVLLAVRRLRRVLARHQTVAVQSVTALGLVWLTCAVPGVRIGDDEPIASMSVGRLVVDEAQAIAGGVRDQRRFEAEVLVDGFRDPSHGELAALRGKDVLVVFVESYGRVAVEGSRSSPPVQAVLTAGTSRLQARGFSAKSAFLTSPTFGGTSWLAHATLQSGLWVDNQWKYDHLLSGDRATLNRAFARAGWRTVAVLPSNRGTWPEGRAYYGFDKVYDRSSFGYAGPKFGFSPMPDQYALGAFQRSELEAPGRKPVMAQIDLTSSHGPWAPLPSLVDWESLGDGSVFDAIHARAESADELWRQRGKVPAAYVRSVEYSLLSVIGFVERYGDDDLVLVVLGDHQPSTIVSGFAGNRDVPITLIARDREVINRISGWGWQDGLRPLAHAPVWPMDAFRDRFLAAYSSSQLSSQPASSRHRP